MSSFFVLCIKWAFVCKTTSVEKGRNLYKEKGDEETNDKIKAMEKYYEKKEDG